MDDVYIRWRASLKKKQKKRTYLHFDKPLDLDDERDFVFVISVIKNIKTHQFLPFLKFVKKDIRYRKDETGTPKREIKPRPIMYASHLDAHIYSFFSFVWAQAYERYIAENGCSENVIAYRKIIYDAAGHGKSNIQFAQEVFEYIQEHEDCVAIVADISKFFDTLKHKILKEQICTVLGTNELLDAEYKMLRSLTAFRFILKDNSKRSVYARVRAKIERERQKGKPLPQAVYECAKKIIRENRKEIGIPQGSPISGLLANIYLSGFDALIRKSFPNSLYRRYSDDIVIVCPANIAETALLSLKEETKRYALGINSSKVSCVKFEKQADGAPLCTEVTDGDGNLLKKKYIDYLGFEFDGRTVSIRHRTIQRSYQKTHKRIRKYHARQEDNYKHKTHRHKEKYKGQSYLDNAAASMRKLGSKIDSQREKFKKFIQRTRRSTKDSDTLFK